MAKPWLKRRDIDWLDPQSEENVRSIKLIDPATYKELRTHYPDLEKHRVRYVAEGGVNRVYVDCDPSTNGVLKDLDGLLPGTVDYLRRVVPDFEACRVALNLRRVSFSSFRLLVSVRSARFEEVYNFGTFGFGGRTIPDRPGESAAVTHFRSFPISPRTHYPSFPPSLYSQASSITWGHITPMVVKASSLEIETPADVPEEPGTQKPLITILPGMKLDGEDLLSWIVPAEHLPELLGDLHERWLVHLGKGKKGKDEHEAAGRWYRDEVWLTLRHEARVQVTALLRNICCVIFLAFPDTVFWGLAMLRAEFCNGLAAAFKGTTRLVRRIVKRDPR